MKRVVWSQNARQDLREAIAFIAERDLAAAGILRQRIRDAVLLLARHSIGRPGRVDGLLEKLVVRTRYTISYSISGDTLLVVRIVHQSRDWPEGGWPAD